MIFSVVLDSLALKEKTEVLSQMPATHVSENMTIIVMHSTKVAITPLTVVLQQHLIVLSAKATMMDVIAALKHQTGIRCAR